MFAFKSSATEAKYLFSLLATASDSVMVSFPIISFSGKLLEAVLPPLFTSRRCFHKDLVSFEFAVLSEKYLRFACRMSCFVSRKHDNTGRCAANVFSLNDERHVINLITLFAV